MTFFLQRLYDSQISFAISALWDRGFEWKLGDEKNGFVAEGRADTLDQTVVEIVRAALRHFPDSEFAQGINS